MPEYVCRMATPSGEIVERVMVAEDEGTIRRELEGKDCLVLDLRQRNELLGALRSIFRLRSRISQREFLFFNQELRALLKAGLPVLASLDILIERRKNVVFKRALEDIRARVRSGQSLSEGFASHGDLFPKLYASSLASGERSGELPTMLNRFVDYSRTVLAIRRKVVSALVYPAILLGLCIGLVCLMVFYIVPKFKEFIDTLGGNLPLPTQILMAVSTFLASNWMLVLLGTVVGTGVFLAWVKTAPGRLWLDGFKMKIPLVGSVIHDYAQTRFTRTLATLVAGGIPLVSSLELAARAVANLVWERALMVVTERVREGQSLWESLEKTGLVSDIAVEMVKVGESTGSLEEMLTSASEFTEEEIDQKLTRVVTMIEPLMLIFMAIVVGGMLLAIYLPLIQTAGQGRF
jgi:type IV pilus assembly protein PilC